jgi:hypothetical protein
MEERFWRYALKGYFNARNPDWLVSKQLDLGRSRLKLQPHAHF